MQNTPPNTQMTTEAAEAPHRIAQMLDRNKTNISALMRRMRAAPPRLVMTCARGSSDHASSYLQSLIQTQLGIPAMSLPPSVASVYDVDMPLKDVLFIVISQSGQSPDLVAGAKWAARNGAYVVAIVNVEASPVAAAAHEVLPLHAGPETSVAATKSFLASLATGAQLVSAWQGDTVFTKAVADLPRDLDAALALDWSAALPAFSDAQNAFIVGRGPGLGAAAEIALKLKETSVIHAEAVSSAEIMHGPLGALRDNLPVLLLGQNDATRDSVRSLSTLLSDKGATVCSAYEGAEGAITLPVISGLHPCIAPLAAVQSFYRFASDLAVRRGFNPDQPEHLKKVTETR